MKKFDLIINKEKAYIIGSDLDKISIVDDINNMGEKSISIKYNKNEKIKNIKAFKDKEKLIITFLDKQFWTYGDIYSYMSPVYTSQPCRDILKLFLMQGKNYTDIDLKVITLFSKYNYQYPVEIIEKPDINYIDNSTKT